MKKTKNITFQPSNKISFFFTNRGPAAFNIEYVSEVADAEYGTVVLPGANVNTEQGHCQKTEAILNYFNRHAKKNNW